MGKVIDGPERNKMGYCYFCFAKCVKEITYVRKKVKVCKLHTERDGWIRPI